MTRIPEPTQSINAASYEAVAAKLRAARVPESIIRETADLLTCGPYEATPCLAFVVFDDERSYRFAVADWLRRERGEFMVALSCGADRTARSVRVVKRLADNTTVAQEWVPPVEFHDMLSLFVREPVWRWPEGFFRDTAALIRHQPERAAFLGWHRPGAVQPAFA